MKYTQIMLGIIRKLFNEDIGVIAILMNEQAEGKTDFLKERITELKELCDKALKEIEDKDDVERK